MSTPTGSTSSSSCGAVSGTWPMRVHERGSGETRSCGTGAGAVLVAVATADAAPRPATYTVDVPGGTLTLDLDRGRPGPADRTGRHRGPGHDQPLTGPRLPSMNLEGASAVVTGAASGIGDAVPVSSPRRARRSSSPTSTPRRARRSPTRSAECSCPSTSRARGADPAGGRPGPELGPLRALVNSAGIGSGSAHDRSRR